MKNNRTKYQLNIQKEKTPTINIEAKRLRSTVPKWYNTHALTYKC